MKRFFSAASLVLSIGCTPKHEVTDPSTPRRPLSKMVVVVIVDQLAAWEMEERFPLLDPNGGFAMLAKRGLSRELHFSHAVTDTAPGHAALYTGSYPAKNGVFSNELLGPTGKLVSLYRDEQTQTVRATGVSKDFSSSAKRLLQDTVVDRVQRSFPALSVTSLSYKDRAAIAGGGHHPTTALWFDSKAGEFISSSAFVSALPSWSQISKDGYPSTWTMRRPEWVREHAACPDDAKGEGAFGGMGTLFPHPLSQANWGEEVRATPIGDAILLDMAIRAIDADHLGKPRPSYLAVSLSSHDYVGHLFGRDSWEAWDELDQLDQSLARFIHALDDRFGPTGYVFLLSSDHGGGPIPEAALCRKSASDPRWGSPSESIRVDRDKLVVALEDHIAHALGERGPWVFGIAPPYVSLTTKGRGRASEVFAAVRNFTMAGIASWVRVSDERAECNKDAARDPLLCNTLHPDSGEIFVELAAGAYFDPEYAPGLGGGHGARALYSRAVPFYMMPPHPGVPVGPVTPITFANQLGRALMVMTGQRSP